MGGTGYDKDAVGRRIDLLEECLTDALDISGEALVRRAVRLKLCQEIVEFSARLLPGRPPDRTRALFLMSPSALRRFGFNASFAARPFALWSPVQGDGQVRRVRGGR